MLKYAPISSNRVVSLPSDCSCTVEQASVSPISRIGDAVYAYPPDAPRSPDRITVPSVVFNHPISAEATSGTHVDPSRDYGALRRQEWSERRQALLDRRPVQGCEEEEAWLREMKATWDRYGQQGLLGGMDYLSLHNRKHDERRRWAFEDADDERVRLAIVKAENVRPIPVYDKAKVKGQMVRKNDLETLLAELRQSTSGVEDHQTDIDTLGKSLSIRQQLFSIEDKLTDWSKVYAEAEAGYWEALGKAVPFDVSDMLLNRSKLAKRNLEMFQQDFAPPPPPISIESKWENYMRSLTQVDFKLGSGLQAVPGAATEVWMRNRMVKFHAVEPVYTLEINKHYLISLDKRDRVKNHAIWPTLGSDIDRVWARHIPDCLKKSSNNLLKVELPMACSDYDESIVHDAKHFLQRMFTIFRNYHISYAQATVYLLNTDRFVGKIGEKVRLHTLRSRSASALETPSPYAALFEPLDSNAEPEVAFKQFKGACEFIIENSVVVPSDESINSILRHMVAGGRNFDEMRDVWYDSLRLDSQLRFALRQHNYYIDLWEGLLERRADGE
jgi:hypothetical protein